MIELAVADIGGTHARFAKARVDPCGQVSLGDVLKLRTADHANLGEAWAAFVTWSGEAPSHAAIAVAGPIDADPLKLTNSAWTISRSTLEADLGVESALLLNDFAAVGHAVAALSPAHFRPVCGPARGFADREVIAVIGPGTGLGVAHVLREGESSQVIAGEGGHAAFAPVDANEDALLHALRQRFGRVSLERLVSGPGLMTIFQAQAAIKGRSAAEVTEAALWERALSGTDSGAVEALSQLCRAFGSTAGDIALIQGATAVVLAGGIGLRLAEHLPTSDFAARFAAKGRFADHMDRIPVRVLTHPEPGLYGAACAYARQRMQG